MTRGALVCASLCASLCAAGCTPEAAVKRGGELFHDSGFTVAASNVFSCATCHATSAAESLQLPGYTMVDAASRPSWWGGAYLTLFDAVNECRVQFMAGAALTRDDDDGRALLVYLESISPDPAAPALPDTIEKTIVTDPTLPGYIASGDAGRGATTWTTTCANCHGAAHTGAGRLSSAIPILPEATLAAYGSDPDRGARPVTVEKVRHGNFFDVGGVMPEFSVEALSDGDLGDLLAFLTL